MSDAGKTKAEIINELNRLRRKIARFKRMEVGFRKTEKELKESEKQYRQLAKTSMEASAIYGEGKILAANQKFVQMFGYKKSELIGMDILNLFAHEYRNSVKKNIFSEYKKLYQVVGLKKDGPSFIAEIYTYKRCKARVIVICDVVGQKEKGEEFIEFKTISDVAQYGAAIVDISGKIVYLNKSFADMHGYKERELVGKHFSVLHSKNQMRRVNELFTMIKKSQGYANEKVGHIRKNGTVFLTSMSGSLIKDDKGIPVFMAATAVDISEDNKVERVLQEERVQLLSIFDSIDEVIYVADPVTYRILYMNKYFENILGKNSVGKLCYQEFQGLKQPCNFCTNKIILRKKDEPYRWEYYNPFLNKHYAIADRIIKWSDGRDVRFEIAMDITNLKKAEEEVRREKEFAEALIETAQVIVLVLDPKGKIISFNPYMEELSGYTIDQVRNKSWFNTFLPKQDRVKTRRLFLKSIDGIQTKGNINAIIIKDGKRRHIEWHDKTLKDKQGKTIGLLATGYDVTERREAERVLIKYKDGLEQAVTRRTQELVKTQKKLEDAKRLSDIGMLAATVAHELNNPLGVIKTAVFNIRRKVESRVIDTHLLNIEKKISESVRIINNLLSYSHIKIPRYENIAVLKILEECLIHCKERYSRLNLKIKKDYSCKENKTIEADSLHMNELFSNILENSFQSFNNKNGRLSIIVNCDNKMNEFNMVVKDNGKGLSKKDLSKVFEPFFTNKAKGIGLGLTVCKEVVALHKGTISISSKEGVGTTVFVSLPISKKS
ncbi:MAG: PAS domain S-box protein [Candidatus Saelkia tenebricola]|nr:PAS domain S-box protein [Candidatus Saelkia tenebricola]